MRSIGARRILLGLSAAALALSLGAAPAAAAHKTGETGIHGAWFVNDTQAAPGFTCRYDQPDPGALNRIYVKPPVLFARDRNGGRNSQKVTWRFRILQSHDAVHFGTIYTSTEASATAYDDTAAVFATRFHDISNPNDQYTVAVDAYWFAPGSSSTKEGSVKIRYDWYWAVKGSQTYKNPDYCLEHY